MKWEVSKRSWKSVTLFLLPSKIMLKLPEIKVKGLRRKNHRDINNSMVITRGKGER